MIICIIIVFWKTNIIETFGISYNGNIISVCFALKITHRAALCTTTKIVIIIHDYLQ